MLSTQKVCRCRAPAVSARHHESAALFAVHRRIPTLEHFCGDHVISSDIDISFHVWRDCLLAPCPTFLQCSCTASIRAAPPSWTASQRLVPKSKCLKCRSPLFCPRWPLIAPPDDESPSSPLRPPATNSVTCRGRCCVSDILTHSVPYRAFGEGVRETALSATPSCLNNNYSQSLASTTHPCFAESYLFHVLFLCSVLEVEVSRPNRGRVQHRALSVRVRPRHLSTRMPTFHNEFVSVYLCSCQSNCSADHRVPVYFTRFLRNTLAYTPESVRKMYANPDPAVTNVLLAISVGTACTSHCWHICVRV